MDPQRIWEHYQRNRLDAFDASRPRLTFLLDQIARRCPGTPHVLNIGVGDGFLDRQAKAAGWRIESVDPDAHAISRLVADGITGHVAGIERLPQADGSMDVVVATEVLEHLNDHQLSAGVSEIARVLKPGGLFIGTVPHAENLLEQQAVCPRCNEVFHRWGHQRSLTIDDVRALLAPGFAVERISRTAFVDLRRGVRGFAKGMLRILLAKLGSPIAVPTIWWVARKIMGPTRS